MELKKRRVMFTLTFHTPMEGQGEDRTPSLEAKQGAFLRQKCFIKNLLLAGVKTEVLIICAVRCDSNSQAKKKKKNSCS